MFKKKEQNYKYCPRCDTKCIISADSCSDCGLVFSRLQIATNKDAKKKILRRDTDFIIKTADLPSDVNFFVLAGLSIFFGLFGAHSFYVGRYVRGLIALIPTLILISFVIFNEQMIAIDGTGATLGVLTTLFGFFIFMWPIDIMLIFMKKFKVPIAIDIDETEEKK